MSAGTPGTSPWTTPERVALRKLARDFVRREIAPHMEEWEDAGELPRSLHRAAAEVGILGVGFAEEVGISGVPLEEFNTCVTSGRYLGWAVNSTQAFYDAEVPGTPAGFLNGTQLDGAQLADQAGLEKLVADATQQ